MSSRGWSVADIPDLTGGTAVVTGANRGIGLEVARGLAGKGAHAVLAVRRTERGEAAAAAIQATSPGASLEVMALDLADLASVHRFAAAIRSRWQALDLLINNAGVGSASLQRTADGFELAFGTNHLGHFALTGLLLPAMTGPPAARVVTVASLAHAPGHIDFGNLDASKGYAELRAYAQSKLANLLFAYELHRRLSATGAGLLSVAAHPGWAATDMNIRPPQERRRPVDQLWRALTKRLAAPNCWLPLVFGDPPWAPSYCRPPWASRSVAVRGRMAVCAAGWSGGLPAASCPGRGCGCAASMRL
jgi:NAD(P)-dependent dehydrogenase (short-subunit alcohol dehydrogenase family)